MREEVVDVFGQEGSLVGGEGRLGVEVSGDESDDFLELFMPMFSTSLPG